MRKQKEIEKEHVFPDSRRDFMRMGKCGTDKRVVFYETKKNQNIEVVVCDCHGSMSDKDRSGICIVCKTRGETG